MEQFIGCDAHKKFSVFVAVNEKGHASEALRVAHDRQLYREFLARLPAHSAIAVEASSSYSWLVDEMERLGHRPKLCNPLEAKRRMGLTNKTDKLDSLPLPSIIFLMSKPRLLSSKVLHRGRVFSARRGRLRDAKSIAGILFYLRFLA